MLSIMSLSGEAAHVSTTAESLDIISRRHFDHLPPGVRCAWKILFAILNDSADEHRFGCTFL